MLILSKINGMVVIRINEEITEKTLSECRKIMSAKDNEVFVDIDSPGGDLSAAWKIYDLFRESAKKVKINVSGDCMSAASVILLAASVENRTASKNAQFMIHKPYVGFYSGSLDGDTAKAVSNNIDIEADRIKRLYIERTNLNDSCVKLIMEAQQIFNAEMALNFGFIGSINQYLNNNMSERKSFNERVLTLVASALGLKNENEETVIECADGTQFSVKGPELVVGVETNEPDGVKVLPDGKRVLIQEGKVTEIQEATPQPNEEEKKEDDELANLHSQVKTLEARLKEKEDELGECSYALETAMATLNKLSALKSKEPNVKSLQPSNNATMTLSELENLMKI